MREISAFFRHCPSCGRRFHIKLVSKEEVGEQTYKEELTSTEAEMESGLLHANRSALPLPLNDGAPVIVDIEEFRYTYLCKHCGHQWAETREKEQEYKA